MIVAAPVRALIFDFDGVLADTEGVHCAAFQSALAGVGVVLSHDDYFERFLGLPDRDCLAAACAHAGVDATPARIETLLAHKRAAFARRAQTAGLYSGVAETLRRLHAHFILAIASGAFRDEIEPILERAQVRPLFSAVLGADDVSRGKPAPDPFLCALRALGATHDLQVSAAECIVIEDAPRGIEAAHAAGMRCIAVTTHHDRSALAAADAVITHVNQLRAEDLGR